MPQIKVRGMKVENVCKISKELIDELEKIIGCPRDYLTIEHMNSIFIMDGEKVEGYPFIEVAWFDRGQEIQDEVAKVITKYVQSQGYEGVDIMFTVFEKHRYYENGEHF
ncbi:DUF1904 domain-containing protein [Clostridium ganghwense]|uniref:DUF1904 domain-containing protein n=1 Tax=Clostridium ganghwense TaxID=312089 RepID=A0ABT4CUG3_9CLOT|nr:DUF1904 domain-containing protein [Clostridium ganghwense]MCY6372696.1 DUF1904 domain-containing protein [Clostridium ganghwense]